MKANHLSYQPLARQQGVVLFIALVALVSMILAALALIRSTTTTNQIAGNLAFKQNASHAADTGVETARAWLINQAGVDPSSLYADMLSNRYKATREDPADWGTYFKVAGLPTSTDSAGNVITYVIHRLCSAALAPSDPSNQCISNLNNAGATPGNSRSGGKIGINGTTQIYYRITVQVQGAGNTYNQVQVVVLI